MKKILSILLAVFASVAVFAVGCNDSEQDNNSGNKDICASNHLRYIDVTIYDADGKYIYSDRSLAYSKIETLNLDEIYYLQLDCNPGNMVISSISVTVEYNEQDFEIISIESEDIWQNPRYSLRGLRECENSVIKFTTKHKDTSGNTIECSIPVNFTSGE